MAIGKSKKGGSTRFSTGDLRDINVEMNPRFVGLWPGLEVDTQVIDLKVNHALDLSTAVDVAHDLGNLSFNLGELDKELVSLNTSLDRLSLKLKIGALATDLHWSVQGCLVGFGVFFLGLGMQGFVSAFEFFTDKFGSPCCHC